MSKVEKNMKKYKLWVNIISIAIPVVVALLFGIKLPNIEPLTFLPPIYASINAITSILLISAFIAIRNKKMKLH
jgi:putative membrane protein